MKRSLNTLFSFCCLFLIALACTKDVGLITEVEFQLVEEHVDEGFVNQGLSTTLTIVPEELVEDYTYELSYEIVQGTGYFEDVDGDRWETGTTRALQVPDLLTISSFYIGTVPGEHRLAVKATDSFGFTEEVELVYDLTDVPARWEASSEFSQVELGRAVELSLLFEIISATTDVTYEARLAFDLGAGSLTAAQEDGYVPRSDFSPIVPGTFRLLFTPSELGPQLLVFVLRDSNGQEVSQELSFDVVENIEVASIVLGDGEPVELQLGAEVAPEITFGPPNATDQGITLTSSNPDVLSIGENNAFTAVGLGTAVVTVTSTSNPEATDSVTFTVVDADRIPVTAVTISQQDPDNQGANRQLIATVLPLDASDTDVVWESSDTQIATVDGNGLLTGLTAGSVTVTATSVSDAEINGTISLEISGSALQSGNDITTFALPLQNSVAINTNQHSIIVNVAAGTELNFAPSALDISTGATILPTIDQVRDFNGAVTYTVTAGNGDEQVWTVNVTVSPPAGSAENDITAFSLPEQNSSTVDPDTNTITVNVAGGTNLNVGPLTLTLSPDATISPAIGQVRDFNTAVQYTVTAGNGDEQVWTVNVTVSPPAGSAENDITAFSLPEQNSSTVDPDTNTITVNVADGTNLNVAPQTLNVSRDATISPAIGQVRDFNAPVEYTVTAENGDEQVWTVNVTVSPPAGSAENDITAFSLPEQNSSTVDPDTNTITVNVADGTNLNVGPLTLTLSPDATISPAIGQVRDFNTAVQYTVTAGNGDEQVWTVNVTVSPPAGSAENDITAFSLPEQNSSTVDPDTNTITVNVADGTNLNVAPQRLTLSPDATISPAIGQVRDFNAPVEYTVTAGNGDEQVWTVNVTVSPPAGSAENDITAFSLPEQNSSTVDPDNEHDNRECCRRH